MITINENTLLDLLEECLPALDFCRGGFPVEDVIWKIELVLKLAGRETESGNAGEAE